MEEAGGRAGGTDCLVLNVSYRHAVAGRLEPNTAAAAAARGTLGFVGSRKSRLFTAYFGFVVCDCREKVCFFLLSLLSTALNVLAL